jgi:hypothetical protein
VHTPCGCSAEENKRIEGAASKKAAPKGSRTLRPSPASPISPLSPLLIHPEAPLWLLVLRMAMHAEAGPGEGSRAGRSMEGKGGVEAFDGLPSLGRVPILGLKHKCYEDF